MRRKLRAALAAELQAQASITEKMLLDSHCADSSCYWSAEDLIMFLDDSLDPGAQAGLYKQGSWLKQTPETAQPSPLAAMIASPARLKSEATWRVSVFHNESWFIKHD